jgi:iron complex transport system substrate-binding protein
MMRWRAGCAPGLAWAAALLVLAATPSATATTLTDLTGRQVHLPGIPQRIVALTPAAVEALFALGAGERVVGRGASTTVVPPEASALPVVDSVEALVKLRPDFIVSHPGHHRLTPQTSEPLGVPLLLLQHRSVEEVLEGIALLGVATGRAQEAAHLRTALAERMRALSADSSVPRPRVLLLFGTPRSFLAIGEETYAGDLLRLAGGQNVAARFPRNLTGSGLLPLSLELIVKSRPEWILVVTHGDPERVAEAYRKELEGNPSWQQLPAVALGRVRVLPDDLFATSPGPRLDQALDYLKRILAGEGVNAR